MEVLLAVLSGFGLALVAPVVHRLARGAAGWVLALLPIGLATYFLSLVEPIAAGEPVRTSIPWAPSLGIQLSFYVDGLGLLFALLITGIGALILIYAGGYLKGDPALGRMYALLLAFMASMLGLVLADNVITFFVFWELTSLSSYLLIGYDHDRAEARAAALQALLITGGGGLVLLAGLLLMGYAGESMELSQLLERGDQVRGHALYLPTLLLVLVGAWTKSAQVPFQSWLPAAMEAPTPVSAYLHSATMVKAGVYLLARLNPILGGTAEWETLVIVVGATTMLVGGYLAVMGTDLKQILAYSTISALGTLMFLIGLGTDLAIKAAVVFLLGHAFYKGALFMIAGAVDHETGTRDVNQLGGLRRKMPITATLAVLAALSMAGFGPVFGFIGKEALFESVWDSEGMRALWILIAVATGTMFVAVATIVAARPFFGALKPTPKSPHEAPLSLWLGPLVLAGLGVVLGLVPTLVATDLVTPAVGAILHWPRPFEEPIKLALWHGFNPALALSVVSLVLGIGIGSLSATLRKANAVLDPVLNRGPNWWYHLGLQGLNRVAAWQTRVLQSGYLRSYLIAILATTTILSGYALLTRSTWNGADLSTLVSLTVADIRYYEVGLPILILMSAFMALRSKTRLAAIAALGVVGYSVALVFILYSAPDLAMTQFMIETLVVIVFLLVLYRLPRFVKYSPPIVRFRDALIAITVGGLITALILIANAIPNDDPISTYFAEVGKKEAHGRNIVNVILVDFRALDTLGEITVLAIAGVGIYSLLRLRPEDTESEKTT